MPAVALDAAAGGGAGGAGGLPVAIPVFTADGGGGGGTFLLGCKAGFIFCAAGGLAAKRTSF